MSEFITAAWATLSGLIVTYGLSLLGSLLILLIGRWLSRLLVRAARNVMEKSRLDATLTNFASNILYYVLMATIILAALQNLGFNTTSIVAAFGAAALAIGLALQNSLSNFAAGVMIILVRPFKVGDLAELAGEFGKVERVQMFNTIIVTPDNKTVIIPNGQILSNNITNYSEKGYLRVDMLFGIGYDDDLLKAKEILRRILAGHSKVLDNPTPTVALSELADSSVNFAVRPYALVEDYWDVYFSITEQVKLRFDEEGISIPYPQRDVHMFQAS
jgi:small conductance mechanosensitive channel